MKNFQQGIERYTIDFLVFETLRFIRDALANGKISKYVEYFEFLLGIGSRYYTIEESKVLQKRKEELYKEILEIKRDKTMNSQTIQHEILMRRFLFCKQNENFLFSLISHIGAIKIERTGEINFDVTDYDLLAKIVKYGGTDSDFDSLKRTKAGSDMLKKLEKKQERMKKREDKIAKKTVKHMNRMLPSKYEKKQSDEEIIIEDGFNDGEAVDIEQKPQDIPEAEAEVVFDDETEGDELVFEENIETDKPSDKDIKKSEDKEDNEEEEEEFNPQGFKIYKGDV